MQLVPTERVISFSEKTLPYSNPPPHEIQLRIRHSLIQDQPGIPAGAKSAPPRPEPST